MKVAIHQPNYLPWLGFFNKLAIADLFIILDTAQFTKNSFQNRVKVKAPSGAFWMSQSVKLSDGAFKPTNKICFSDSLWKQKHIKTLQANYAKATYFKEYAPSLFDLIKSAEENLSSYNVLLIKWVSEVLGLRTKIILASDYPASNLTGTDRLIELIKLSNGNAYISGKGGQNYQDVELFNKNGIDLTVLEYVPKEYPQLWGEFVPGLSIVDFIFNCGCENFAFFKTELVSIS